MQFANKNLTLTLATTLAALTLQACSGGAGQTDAAVSAPAASAVTTPAPANATPGSAPVATATAEPLQGEYLYDLLQHPAFAAAFAGMDGVAQLPAWVKTGGTATPARQVTVNGHDQLSAHACKPHACPSEQILVLYDAGSHAMQGVFASDPTPGPDAGISANARLTWLGKPDDASQAWLQQQLRNPSP